MSERGDVISIPQKCFDADDIAFAEAQAQMRLAEATVKNIMDQLPKAQRTCLLVFLKERYGVLDK